MKKKSLVKQLQDNLKGKLKLGHSKFTDKKLGISKNYIYSWSTYETYLKHGCYFVKWARETYGCKTLEDCRQYVDEFILKRISDGVSPYTQKLEASALAKVYDCSTNDFVKTEVRHRKDIKRSRGDKVRDKHFSETKNQDFVDFCRATGLRRSEIKSLNKNQLHYDEQTDTYFLVIKGKGGRIRHSPIIDLRAVDIIKNSDDDLVWTKIPNGADIHSYRADYCKALYNKYARPKEETPLKDRYCCRGDLKGVWYDKKAMAIATQALGHNRISVIAAHYIRRD